MISRPAGRQLLHRLEQSGLLPAAVFVSVAWQVTPMAEVVEFDPDEGVNLVKAMLHAQGHALYDEVWSDQPPLVTLLLAQLYAWGGPSLVAARGLTLAFSTLLVWALYQALRLQVSAVAAWAGVALLVISRMYLRLSVSVMVGLPAVALAMLAIYLLLRSRSVRDEGKAALLLVGSGAALALSMQVKLFTLVVVVPMAVVLVWPGGGGAGRAPRGGGGAAVPEQAERGRRWRRAGVWGAAWLGTWGASAVLLGTLAGEQLVGTHAAAQPRSLDAQLHDLFRLAGMIGRHAIYLPLAAGALVWAWRRGVSDVLLPATWFALAALLLSVHRPLWYHHVLLITVPLAWLAGYGVQAWLDWRTGAGRRLAAAGVVAAGVALPLANPLPRQLHEETFAYRYPLHEDVPRALAPPTPAEGTSAAGWVFTDRPMYAYLADRRVPPAVAVQTSKRWKTAQLTRDDLLAALQRHQPGHVVLERYGDDHYGPEVRGYLERHYDLHRVADRPFDHLPPLRHYMHRDLAIGAPASR